MPQSEEHLRDYLQLVRKHDFTICLSVLLVLGTALAISLRLPKTYAASTLMQLVQPSATPSLSSANLFQSVLSGGGDRRAMTTLSSRFTTESMLNTAIENLEDTRDIEGVAYLPAIGKLKRVLKAQVQPDSDYIVLTLELTEAEGGERNAALLVNQLVADMQVLRRVDEKTKLAERHRFLKEKQADIDVETEKSLNAILQFVRENGSPEIWSPLLTNMLERRASLKTQLEAARQNLEATRSHIAYLAEQRRLLPEQTQLSETTTHNPVWLFQQEKLFTLKSQQVADAEKVGKDLSELKGLDAQITAVETEAERTEPTTTTVTSGISPSQTYIQNQLLELTPALSRYENAQKQLQAQLQTLETELAQLIAQVPENQYFLTQLLARVQKNNALTEEIAKRALEAEILSAESTVPTSRNRLGGIEIIDRAAPRKVPVSPQLKLIVIIAGVVGLTIGVSLALFIEYFSGANEKQKSVGVNLE